MATGRREDLVRSVTQEVEALGRKSLAIATNVGDRASIESLHSAVCAEFGHVDILLNAAGVTKRTPSIDVSETEWNGIFDTNLTGILRAWAIAQMRLIGKIWPVRLVMWQTRISLVLGVTALSKRW